MKLSLHLALNRVSPDAYGGWPGTLNGCHKDAANMAALAATHGFTATATFDDECTRSTVVAQLHACASRLAAGDSFLLTYSGHGGQVPNPNEVDGLAETLCLFDGELTDKELLAALATFPPGVRLYFISDSCHSGGLDRECPPSSSFDVQRSTFDVRCSNLIRAIPHAQPRSSPYQFPTSHLRSPLLVFSACRENQTAADTPDGGAFTLNLMSAARNYESAVWRTLAALTTEYLVNGGYSQIPVLDAVGPNADPLLDAQSFA